LESVFEPPHGRAVSPTMTPLHIASGVIVAAIWGLAFVATRLGLDSFSPPQLAGFRFALAAAPAFFLSRPPIAWSTLILIGSTLFAGQFILQFFGIANGMPPGLASITVQTQAFFTVLFAAVLLREKPTRRQLSGMAVAFGGLAAIACTVGQDLRALGLALTIAAAVSWGVGNVLVKQVGQVDMLNLMVWLSVVPPLPALGLSLLIDGPTSLCQAIAKASWLSIAAGGYLGIPATILAYALWGNLLRLYSAAAVAPFALLVPCFALMASAIALGERFGALRLAGMMLVLLGLAIIVAPTSRWAGAFWCRPSGPMHRWVRTTPRGSSPDTSDRRRRGAHPEGS
jgi:O-acetylserine/cysteine efflux transporter